MVYIRAIKMFEIILIILLFIFIIESTYNAYYDDTSREWSMFRQNEARTGFSNSVSPNTSYLLWTFAIGEKAYSSPVTYGRRLFLVNDNKLFSLDIDNGKEIWSNKIPAMYSTPAISNSMAFIATNSSIVAIDINSGMELWNYLVSGRFIKEKEFKLNDYIVSSPLVFKNRVFVGTGTYSGMMINPPPSVMDEWFIVCLNSSSGKEIWNFMLNDNVIASPSMDGDKLFIASDGLYCLNVKTGKRIWNYVPDEGVFRTSPAISDGKVIIGLNSISGYKILCFDEHTGKILWTYETHGKVLSSAAIAQSQIYLQSDDGKIFALDEFNGKIIWEYQINIDQELYWKGYNIRSSPAIADGKVFVGSVDGNFYCLDAETGRLIWKYKTGGPIYSSPAISDGMVFIASTDGKLYAFGIDPETYFGKAEKYFTERKYERAKEFYLKAKEYYSNKGETGKVNEIEDRISIVEQKIIEDKPRQEDLLKAGTLLEKGSSNLSDRKFRDSLASFKEAKRIYERYEEKYKIRLCEDRIDYSEKRIKEQITIEFIILGSILLIFIVGVVIIRWRKINKSA